VTTPPTNASSQRRKSSRANRASANVSVEQAAVMVAATAKSTLPVRSSENARPISATSMSTLPELPSQPMIAMTSARIPQTRNRRALT
jgi:hypothetical protein